MLELMWIHDVGPECWNLDILDSVEVGLGDRRLEPSADVLSCASKAFLDGQPQALPLCHPWD